jgi:hypothetical protein
VRSTDSERSTAVLVSAVSLTFTKPISSDTDVFFCFSSYIPLYRGLYRMNWAKRNVRFNFREQLQVRFQLDLVLLLRGIIETLKFLRKVRSRNVIRLMDLTF